ncbi:hypothetical protein ACFOEE_08315 [Pseudoalteromonas fenneropenaei]|uniref:Uncharacterized protein n=1 Tax=Pseudoalteromonas fenneropenaei TaxID=1737459 RepID=A0ABV7CIM8_9GAMM
MQLSIVSGQHTYQVRPQQKPVDASSRQQNTQQLDAEKHYVRSSDKAVALLDAQQQDKRSAIYDQPNFKNGVAISAYKNVANDARRQEIRSLIGVDLFA